MPRHRKSLFCKFQSKLLVILKQVKKQPIKHHSLLSKDQFVDLKIIHVLAVSAQGVQEPVYSIVYSQSSCSHV